MLNVDGARKKRYSNYFDNEAPDIALHSMFIRYDTDNDKRLDIGEFMTLLKSDFNLDADQAETYMYLLDRNGDGHISFDEFREWICSEEDLINVTDQTRFYYVRKAIEMFQQYDTDNNFSLDRCELKQLLIETGGDEKNLDVALRELDEDDNGRVSFVEFVKWLGWDQLNKIFPFL